ncbi:MAG: hypothetical protein ABJO36_12155 [Litorimonas sp.]
MKDRITNTEISDILYQFAELLEIDGADKFRIRAYEDAALAIKNRVNSIAGDVENGIDISQFPKIGSHIQDAIEEIVSTGEFIQLIALEQSMSPQIVTLSHIPGIGAKKVQLLLDILTPFSLKKVIEMANLGLLKSLPGIGPKTELAIKTFFENPPRE